MGSIFGLLPATVSPQILQYPLPPRQTPACSGHLQYSTSTRALCIRSRVFAIITNLQTSFMAFNQSFNRCCFSSKTDFQLEVVLSLQLTLEKCISAKFDYLVLPRMPIDTITTTTVLIFQLLVSVLRWLSMISYSYFSTIDKNQSNDQAIEC